MLGVLGLITGWALLTPAALFLWVRFGGQTAPWMRPFLDIAASAPTLGFCTIGGLAAIAWSVGQLSRGERDF
ncbi:MAG: hypothetical protein ABL883_05125 [Terricaulis sp.]